MTMTDPIADMLTRIRNANVAMHDTVRMPGSKLKESLAQDPRARGLHLGLHDLAPSPASPASVLEIQMKYTPERARAIAGLRRVSTPGLRVYAQADHLPRVLGGLGVAVLSTSDGLMTDREARKRRGRRRGALLCLVRAVRRAAT